MSLNYDHFMVKTYYFRALPLKVTIHHRFFDGSIGIIPETPGFGQVGVFDYRLLEIVGMDMAQCVTSDTCKRGCKDLLVKAISSRPFREPDDINLCRREDILRMVVKKEQADVFRRGCFRQFSCVTYEGISLKLRYSPGWWQRLF